MLNYIMILKIIFKKFLNHKKKFIILRMGNVFGFNAYNNLKQIKDNLIHSLCISAKFKNKILIKMVLFREHLFHPKYLFN